MHVVTGAQMREADRLTIEEIGIPSRVLMESAGRAVVGAMTEHLPDLASRSVAIVCGKGNNGGDGLVVLRVLAAMGCDVRAVVLSPLEELTSDALENFQSALKLKLPVLTVTSLEEWDSVLDGIERADVLVDAVLGTGLTEAVRGFYGRVVEDLDELTMYKVAVDLPSGLSADTGMVPGAVLGADLTVALAAPKVCHFVSPASEHCGLIEVADIGIPPELLVPPEPHVTARELEDTRGAWASRDRSAHKGSFGHLLVVSGSTSKTGAAVLVARAALRSGAGLVTVASARSAIPIMAAQVPEVMWEALPETDEGTIASGAHERLMELAVERDALAMGPGLGTSPETASVLASVLTDTRTPAILDADALRTFDVEDGSPARRGELGITPHPGEAARLLGTSSGEVQRDRLAAVRRLAHDFGCHALLKGHRSLVSDPRGNVSVNPTGNPGMATAGSGDVLTGILGGLVAQGVSIGTALGVGAYAHGLAGDLAAAAIGQAPLVASDLIDRLPDAVRALGSD